MKDRVLALAGLLQSVRLVQQMANNGQAETRPLASCIDSLFRFDAESTEAVYGSARALEPGLRRVARLEPVVREPRRLGGNDDLVFDGRSCVFDATGATIFDVDLDGLGLQLGAHFRF